MKTKIIGLLTGVISLGVAGTAASAADMAVKARPAPPLPPPCVWCGFYIGLNGGYGWGRDTGDLVAFSGGLGIPLAVAGGTIPSHLGVRPEGWLAGGQVGYNWQVNQIVFGIEADIQGSGIRDSVSIFNPGTPALAPTLHTAKSQLDWFGTVRGRLGFAAGNVLLYGTAGGAYGGVQDSVTSLPNPAPPFTPLLAGSTSDTRFGWTAGAGFEWAIAPNWSFKGEYLHVDLGSSNTTAVVVPPGVDFLTYRFRHEYDMVRVGFNWRFGGGPVVAKY